MSRLCCWFSSSGKLWEVSVRSIIYNFSINTQRAHGIRLLLQVQRRKSMYVGHREEVGRPQRASLVSFPDLPGVTMYYTIA